MSKILTVFGNRPQFIKSAPVSDALREQGLLEVTVNTGQHFDANMSDVFFKELNLKTPDYNLNINNLSDLQFISKAISTLEDVYLKEKPDFVMVYGDTNTTLSAAIAAKKLRLRLAHVEAGPRMGDKTIPEEYNRILVDHSSDLLFAPDRPSVSNLNREGITDDKVVFAGDVMLDTYLKMRPQFMNHTQDEEYYVCTFHRQENVDSKEALERLCDLLLGLNKKIIFPMHPRTKKSLSTHGLWDKLISSSKIVITEPLSYVEMMSLVSNAQLVLTDSGGLQKEAFFASKPCYVFLNVTPWPELESLGWQKVMGSLQSRSVDVKHVSPDAFPKVMTSSNNGLEIFGGGRASNVITDTLKKTLAA